MLTTPHGWLAETRAAEEPNVIKCLETGEWHQHWKEEKKGVKSAGLRNKLQYNYSDYSIIFLSNLFIFKKHSQSIEHLYTLKY